MGHVERDADADYAGRPHVVRELEPERIVYVAGHNVCRDFFVVLRHTMFASPTIDAGRLQREFGRQKLGLAKNGAALPRQRCVAENRFMCSTLSYMTNRARRGVVTLARAYYHTNSALLCNA